MLKSQSAPSQILGPKRGTWWTLNEIRKDRLAFTCRLAREYGDLAQFRMGWRRFLLVNDPTLVRQVLLEHPERYRKGIGLAHARDLFGDGLLTSEGPLWRSQRQNTAFAFSHRTIAGLGPAMARVIEHELDGWSTVAQRGQPLILGQALSRLTLRVLGRVLLGQDLREESQALMDGVSAGLDHAMQTLTHLTSQPWRAPHAMLRYRLALRNFHRSVDRIIDRVQSLPADNAAPLQALLRAHRENSHATDTLHDEVATLLIVGHETTACLAIWAFILLAQHPRAEAQVRAEVEQGEEGGKNVSDLGARLPYTRACLKETLRLYPPVWLIPREAIVDHELGGVSVGRKTGVLISPFTLHRHAEYWPDPEKFRPERFLDHEPLGCTSGAWLPFGLGPRACVGAGFAVLELQLILERVLQRYRLHFLENPRGIVPQALLTLRPSGQLNVRLEAQPSSDCSAGSL